MLFNFPCYSNWFFHQTPPPFLVNQYLIFIKITSETLIEFHRAISCTKHISPHRKLTLLLFYQWRKNIHCVWKTTKSVSLFLKQPNFQFKIQLIVYNFSCLFTFLDLNSAVCLPLQLKKSAVCLHMSTVYLHFPLNKY